MGKIERVPAGTAPRTRRVGEPLFMERHKIGVVSGLVVLFHRHPGTSVPGFRIRPLRG